MGRIMWHGIRRRRLGGWAAVCFAVFFRVPLLAPSAALDALLYFVPEAAVRNPLRRAVPDWMTIAGGTG